MPIVPILLIDITQGETVHRFATADCYDGSTEYKGVVKAHPAVRDTFTEVYSGFLEHGDVTVELSDEDGEIKELLWGVAPVDWRGARVTLARADYETSTQQINRLVSWEEGVSWESGASWETPYTKTTEGLTERFAVSGRVDRVDYEDVVRVSVSFREPDELSKLLPARTVTAELFPDAPEDSLGASINILFGRCKKVPLTLVKNDSVNNEAHYLVGWGVSESNDSNKSTTVNLYRNDVVVGSTEMAATVVCYDGSAGSPFEGYATVKFTGSGWEQRDVSGNFYELKADWYGLEMGDTEAQRNFVEVIRNVLSDATWGLGLSVDSDSFDAAAAVTDIAVLKCDGAVTSQTRAKEIIDALVFCCMGRLTQGADGSWFISVDGEYVSESAGTFSTAEGNIVQAGPRYRPSSRDAIKTIQFEYARAEDGSYEFTTSSRTVNADFGEDKVERLDFVRDKETADRIACWTQRLHLYTAERLDLVLGQDAKTLNAGDVISLSVPRLNVGIMGDNLVPNGTMEADSDWASYGTPTVNERSSEQAHSGTYSRKFTVNSNQEGIWSSYFTVEAGKHYRCRVWVYPTDYDNVQISIRKGDNSAYVDYTNHTGLTLNQWNLIEVEYDEPVGGAYGYIRVSSYNRTTGTWYVDDVSLVELLSNGEYRVIDLERGLEGFTATVAAYSSELYTYDEGTLPGDGEESGGADYSRTPPDDPTDIGVSSSGAYVAQDGGATAFFVVEAVKGADSPSNFAKIVFGCKKDGETTYRWQDGQDAGSGTWKARFDGLTPGLQYDFAAKAVNNFALESTAITLENQLAPGDTTGPSSPFSTSVTAAKRSISLEWNNPADEDFKWVGIWRKTNGSAPNFDTTAPTFSISGGPGEIMQKIDDKATGYTTTYYYWIRAFDNTGNPSSTAGVYMGSATPAQQGTDDYADLSITTAKIGNLAVTEGKIANLAVTNAKIANLSVDKLISGVIAAGVSVTLDNGADIIMRAADSGEDQAEIKFLRGSTNIATIWGNVGAGTPALNIAPLEVSNSTVLQFGVNTFRWYASVLSLQDGALSGFQVLMGGSNAFLISSSTLGTATLARSLLPSGTRNLGSSSYKWSNVYGASIRGDDFYAGGTQGVPSSETTNNFVYDLRWNGGTLQARVIELKHKKGIVTSYTVGGTWNTVPTV